MMFFAVLKYQTVLQGEFEAIIHGLTHKEILEKIDTYTKFNRIKVTVYKTSKLFELNEQENNDTLTTEERVCL